MPSIIGNGPPPCSEFILTSLPNNKALLFGGYIPNTSDDTLYIAQCTKTTIVSIMCTKINIILCLFEYFLPSNGRR